ncbi:MAG: hypothetical protein WC608_04150 [Parcubacteria group bacterium]
MNTPEIKSKNCTCFQSGKAKVLIVAAIALGIIILMLGSFAGGVAVGAHKAKFSSDWGKNYEQNFMGSRQGEKSFFGNGMTGMMQDFSGRDFRNAHGLAGTIISIADNNVIVKDKDGKENTVIVTEKTLIKSRQADLKVGDLKADDQIVAIGSPDEGGVVNAVLIRVFNNQNNQ